MFEEYNNPKTSPQQNANKQLLQTAINKMNCQAIVRLLQKNAKVEINDITNFINNKSYFSVGIHSRIAQYLFIAYFIHNNHNFEDLDHQIESLRMHIPYEKLNEILDLIKFITAIGHTLDPEKKLHL
ncbi:hypothetical protein L3V82_10955 [Thiotrichales bacterium 19S3-7]|nr:hypothetical protein [Thiotrichales bacterium 19S3-7]MCF6802698.1 hypothetical protein [Thiotrichales bacterium 19S3-11]